MRSRESIATWLSLLSSTGTLLCCALPVAFVSLGLGAVIAGLTAEVPWLTTLSRYKAWLFIGAAALLGTSGWLIHRPGRVCPDNPVLAKHCARLDRWNRRAWWSAAAVWAIGFFTAYLALPIRMWLENR